MALAAALHRSRQNSPRTGSPTSKTV